MPQQLLTDLIMTEHDAVKPQSTGKGTLPPLKRPMKGG